MFKRLALLSVFSLCFACAQTPIPNTPAGQTLRAWLVAFNSGDRARVETFLRKYQPKGSVEKTMEFRASTGTLELLAIDKIEPTRIRFRVKQEASSKTAIGELDLTDSTLPQIVNLNFVGL